MKIFLTSSGLSDKNEKDFLSLFPDGTNGLKVAFIPTAMNEEPEEVKQKYIPVDVADLENLGMEVDFIDLEKVDEENVIATFLPYDVIYVYGGNTFHLMNYANKSGFTKHILEIIKNKVYVGVSAGSVIVGPDIEVAQWGKDSDRNTIGLKDTTGLNIVPFCIIPHYQDQEFSESQNYQFEVKFIWDEEAIVINN